MKRIPIITLTCTVLLLLAACNAPQQESYQTLRAGFAQVPDSVRPGCFWYWISDNISREGVAEDLKAMKEAGIGAAFIGCIGETEGYDYNYPTGPVTFYSDEWWEVLHTALRTATELGIDIGIFNCPGWSQSGGPWIKPEQAMRYLTKAELRLTGPAKAEQAMPKPVEDFEDVCVLAFPVEDFPDPSLEKKVFPGYLPRIVDHPSMAVDKAQVTDISACLGDDGVLRWDVPEGNWVVMRLGMTPTGVVNGPATPEATGLEADKMSREHIAYHFDAYLGEIMRRIPEEDRRCWKYTIVDSYEKNWQNFTDNMVADFIATFGYDPTPYLPAYYGYAVGSVDQSRRFLWDVRRFLADRVATEYVGGLRDKSHEHGLKVWLENYGHWGFCSEFLKYGGQSDEISGEFWTSRHTAEKRASSSCAHIYGKPRAWAESFTSDGREDGWETNVQEPYSRHPRSDKHYLDLAFSQGINSVIFHVFISQYADDTYPGVDAWFGTEYNRKNTWFSQVDAFVDYIRRSCYLLQQGTNVADVLYYIGQESPIMSVKNTPALPKGYDFDYVNAEVLLTATVRDGRVCLPSGVSYSVLVLPPVASMGVDVLQKVAELAQAGAVVIGPPPTQAAGLKDYPQADEQLLALADQLWNTDKVVRDGLSLEDVLAELGLQPDFDVQADDVLYAHRRLADGTEVYFVCNQADHRQHVAPSFRVTGKGAEVWDPVGGDIKPAHCELRDGATGVHLCLEPDQSLFVVFSDQCTNEPELEICENLPDFATPWTVTFQSDDVHRGPAEPIEMTELTDWSQSADERIRDYSGEAVYRNTFALDSLPQGARVFLLAEEVGVMARVKVNGQVAGSLWVPPYQVDITDCLREGDNEVEITVVSTWYNRALADKALPASERRLNVHTWPWCASGKPQPSGLMGEVRLELIR